MVAFALSENKSIASRLHNLVPHVLVPEVVIKAVLSGIKPFAVGTGSRLALVGMAFFEMSVLASPMLELSMTFGAWIDC